MNKSGEREKWIKAIRALMRADGYRPLKQHELARALHAAGASRRHLRHALYQMAEAGEIVSLRKNRWAPAGKGETITGSLEVHPDGFAFVTPERGDEDLFVPAEYLGAAIHGDQVRVSLLQRGERGRRGRRRSNPEARIVEVVKRERREVVGRFLKGPGYDYVIPDHRRIPQNIRVREIAAGISLALNDKVVVQLDDWQADHPVPEGVVVERIGAVDEPGVDVLSIARDHQFRAAYREATLQQAAQVLGEVSEKDRAGREDLRNRVAFTIDPVDARDYDDAVSLEKLSNGNWRLGVHIADVAHYVPMGSAMDQEAADRGNTTYLVDRTITMLPPDVTTEVCSLRPEVDRLTHTVDIELDSSLNIVGSSSYRSVLCSAARLSYQQVQACFDEQNTDGIPNAVCGALEDLLDITQRLRAQRVEAGSIDLAMPDIRCVLDRAGQPVRLERRSMGTANQLIEECMLLANRVVAERILSAGYPGIFRTHEPPEDDQWARMAVELHALGVPESPRTSAEINQVARMVRGRPVAYAAQLAMLRNFKQARYTLTCDGHFGLAFDRYLHFTSPIRRYADLVTHRVLNAIEDGEPPPYDESNMQRVAHQCSVREREAIQCERESLEMKRTMFYRRELAAGRTGPFRGMIAGVTKSGLVIELLETLQQGFIHFSSIDHDYYVVNRDHTQATGRRFRRTFTLGMAVSVVLAAVEDYGSRVTFRLAESPSEQPRRHRRRR